LDREHISCYYLSVETIAISLAPFARYVLALVDKLEAT